MSRFLATALFGAILTIPAILPTALQAQTYHDAQHNDDHEWNAHEDQAYRIYVKQNHRKYVEFSKARPEDQQSYWAWRHEHSDAQLKINIK